MTKKQPFEKNTTIREITEKIKEEFCKRLIIKPTMYQNEQIDNLWDFTFDKNKFGIVGIKEDTITFEVRL